LHVRQKMLGMYAPDNKRGYRREPALEDRLEEVRGYREEEAPGGHWRVMGMIESFALNGYSKVREFLFSIYNEFA
jgi:hypothetical protein